MRVSHRKKNPHHSRLMPRALFLSMFELRGSNTDTVRFSSTSTKVSSNEPDENRKLVSCWGSASWMLMFGIIEQKSHVDQKVITLFFSLSVRIRTLFITRDACVLWMFTTVVMTCLFFSEVFCHSHRLKVRRFLRAVVMLSHLLGTRRRGKHDWFQAPMWQFLICRRSWWHSGGNGRNRLPTQNTNILKTLTKTKKTTGQHNPIRS